MKKKPSSKQVSPTKVIDQLSRNLRAIHRVLDPVYVRLIAANGTKAGETPTLTVAENVASECEACRAILQDQDAAFVELQDAFGIERGTFDGEPDKLVAAVAKVHERKLKDIGQLVTAAQEEAQKQRDKQKELNASIERYSADVGYYRDRALTAERLLNLQANAQPVRGCGVGSESPY